MYDGHGGNEVSEYTSLHLPNFIKENEFYKKGDFEKALKESFVKFDCTLKEPEVVELLQKLAKYNEYNNDDESDSEDENLGSLKEEAQMAIEDVMAKYVLNRKENEKTNNSEATQSSSNKVLSNDSVRCSEVSSNETECSSSKSNTSFNESESEVSSSSSSCAVSRKSLSEKYNCVDKIKKPLLDSTSNGSIKSNNSENSKIDTSGSGESNVTPSKVQTESNNSFKKEEIVKSTSSEVVDNTSKSSCNGKFKNSTVENTISSSVENGESNEPKKSGKGKALVKHQPKANVEKNQDSPEKLFQKFIHSGKFFFFFYKYVHNFIFYNF